MVIADEHAGPYGAGRHPSSDPPDFDRLEARLAALEADSRKKPPSWLSEHTASLLVAVIAAVVPASVALHTWISSAAERELAAQQHSHAMRMDYLQTALDTSAPARDREIRLRLLVSLLEDEQDRLRIWASDELARTEKQVEELTAELKLAEHEAAQAHSDVVAAERALSAADDGRTLRRLGEATPREPASAASPAPSQRPAAPEPTEAVAEARSKLLEAKLRNQQAVNKARVSAQKLTGKPELSPLIALPPAGE